MGNKLRAGLLSIALLSVSVSHASKASAWMCGIKYNGGLPRSGAANVPLNTRLWCRKPHKNDSLAPVGSEKESGFQRLALSQRILNTSQFEIHMLKPELELLADTEYAVTCGGSERRFTTGSARLVKAPAVPRLQDMSTVAERGCGAVGGPGMPICSVFFPRAGVKDTIVVLSLPDQVRLGEDARFETLANVQSFLFRAGAASLERSRCEKSWPNAQPGALAFVSAGAFDMAGNFSGWSDTVEVTLPGVAARAISQASPGPSKRVFVASPVPKTSGADSLYEATPSTGTGPSCSMGSASEQVGLVSYWPGLGVLLAARRRRRNLSNKAATVRRRVAPLALSNDVVPRLARCDTYWLTHRDGAPGPRCHAKYLELPPCLNKHA